MSLIVVGSLVGAAQGALQYGDSTPQKLYKKVAEWAPDFFSKATHKSMQDALFTGASKGALYGVVLYVASSLVGLVGIIAAIALLWALIPAQVDAIIQEVQKSVDESQHVGVWDRLKNALRN